MKHIQRKPLFNSLILAITIEVLTHALYPVLYKMRQQHQASYLTMAPVVYLIAFIITVAILLYAFATQRSQYTKLGITFTALALMHTTYLLGSIECSCGVT